MTSRLHLPGNGEPSIPTLPEVLSVLTKIHAENRATFETLGRYIDALADRVGALEHARWQEEHPGEELCASQNMDARTDDADQRPVREDKPG